MKKRFQVLHMIATVFRILSIVTAAVALVLALVTLVMSMAGDQIWKLVGLDGNIGFFGSLMAAFLIVLIGVLKAIMMYGAGELISLLLSIEENSHNTVLLLEKSSKIEPPVS
jgi:hypothetical protein